MSATADQTLEPSAIRRPSAVSRIYGFGRVFGKTLRDARWSVIGWVIGVTLSHPSFLGVPWGRPSITEGRDRCPRPDESPGSCPCSTAS